MLSDVNQMRETTQYVINQNPVSIVITRKTTVPNAGTGGSTVTSSTLPAQTVRISNKLGRQPVEGTPGKKLEGKQWIMLGNYLADVHVEDTFDYDGKHFRVQDVNPVRYEGQVVSIQAFLEVV